MNTIFVGRKSIQVYTQLSCAADARPEDSVYAARKWSGTSVRSSVPRGTTNACAQVALEAISAPWRDVETHQRQTRNHAVDHVVDAVEPAQQPISATH